MLGTDRLRSTALFEKIATPEQAAALIEDGMNVGVGGFTPSGYPKKTTMALAKAIKNGKKCRINIWSGASVGPEIEEELAAVGGVKSRMPYYAASNKSMRAGINGGQIDYIDLHLSHFAQQVDYGFFGNVDVAIVEAAAVNADGSIVLGPGVGNIPMFVKHAKKVIVEVNTTIPLSMEGMHDIYICAKPPHRTEIPIYHVGDRIGSPYLECGLDKIACANTAFCFKPATTLQISCSFGLLIPFSEASLLSFFCHIHRLTLHNISYSDTRSYHHIILYFRCLNLYLPPASVSSLFCRRSALLRRPDGSVPPADAAALSYHFRFLR